MSAPEPHQVLFESRLRNIHSEIRRELPQVSRVCVALRDADALVAFGESSEPTRPLPRFVVPFSGLAAGASQLALRDPRPQPARVGSRASLSRALVYENEMIGFAFFDAALEGYFDAPVQERLEIFGHAIAAALAGSKRAGGFLRTVAETKSGATTTGHLRRVAGYTQLIADGTAGELGHDRLVVDAIVAAAMLHDMGKLRVPADALPPATHESDPVQEPMFTHISRGVELLDRFLQSSQFTDLPAGRVMRNVLLHHHEMWNGRGYPGLLRGEAIPSEARIVSLADVFDALTCPHEAREPWSLTRALEWVREQSGCLFDPRCVRALANAAKALGAIYISSAGVHGPS